MGRFINPFTDVGFKLIFSREISKDLLIDFLNNLLKGERVIRDLSFLDKGNVSDQKDGRTTIYDIYCETDTGERIIVEMQNEKQTFFIDRSVYYMARSTSAQGERGLNWHYEVSAVYGVFFMNFTFADWPRVLRRDVTLMDMHTREPFTDRMRMIYLQLPYFKKEAAECENDFERWIYVLNNMSTLDRMPFAAQNSVFAKLSQIAEVSELSKEERIKYDADIRHYRDMLAQKDYYDHLEQNSIERGLKKGMAQGMAKGMAKKSAEIARNLKAAGLSRELIAQTTGLSFAEIDEL